MSKDGYEPTPSAPLPTAPPPSYEASFIQPAYNPNLQTSLPPYQYHPTSVTHVAAHPPYLQQNYHSTQAAVPAPQAARFVPLLVGPQPLRTTCPNCRTDIKTRTTVHYKGITHLLCLGLCFICCCLCSWVPYCVDSLKQVQHTCPKCKAHLGTYSRS